MHMIGDATDDHGLAIEVFKNAAEVVMELVAQWRFAQKWAALFGGEDGMEEDLGQGLSHEARLGSREEWCNRFRNSREKGIGDRGIRELGYGVNGWRFG